MLFSKEDKVLWLEDFRRSGKSPWAYAKENGLNPQTFIRWTKSETDAKTCFVEVPVKVTTAVPSMTEIIIEKGDLKIHIPLMINRDELRAIMEGLGVVL
jgi:hypothetical protein